MQKENECPCAKADCERRGDCVACYKHHMPMEKPIFCRRPGSPSVKGLEERVIARLRAAGCEYPVENAQKILRSQNVISSS